jgi:hypothetical protein
VNWGYRYFYKSGPRTQKNSDNWELPCIWLFFNKVTCFRTPHQFRPYFKPGEMRTCKYTLGSFKRNILAIKFLLICHNQINQGVKLKFFITYNQFNVKKLYLRVWWFLHFLQLFRHKNAPNQLLMF